MRNQISRKIIIDTDPGVDDALAIILALSSPELEVIGLTTAFGNGTTQQTSLNALRLLELCGRSDIPVAQGALQPFGTNPVSIGTEVHGDDAMGNSNQPEPRSKIIPQHAVDFIIEMAHKYPGELSILAIAPLANLALALEKDPSISKKIKEVIIMGGAVHIKGNITEFAEANFYNDPAAADRVLAADWPVTLVPLDTTKTVYMQPDYVESLKDSPYGEFITKVTPFYFNFYKQAYGYPGFCPHDPIACAYLLKPELFTFEQLALRVVNAGEKRGQTEIVNDASRPRINICNSIDIAGFLAYFKRSMRSSAVLETIA